MLQSFVVLYFALQGTPNQDTFFTFLFSGEQVTVSELALTTSEIQDLTKPFATKTLMLEFVLPSLRPNTSIISTHARIDSEVA